jgi:integrase
VTPLRQRMLEDLQIRHYSPTTIRLYLYAVRAFAKHFGKPPDQLGAEHIRRYQLFLTKEKKVSTSTYVMMICGLRFFYTDTLHRKVAIERIPFPRRERKLPVILSRDEVKAMLEAPSDLARIFASPAGIARAAATADPAPAPPGRPRCLLRQTYCTRVCLANCKRECRARRCARR